MFIVKNDLLSHKIYTLRQAKNLVCIYVLPIIDYTLLKLSTACSLQHYFYDNMQNYTSNDSNVNMVVGQTS